ncbi:MAG: hypothetical protein EAZ95_16060 [Bacteroidetes bacterium]|nr:MAG: hypothetical protein EAZ95_16060 [Bacteroidota bacterium]
MVQKMKAMKQKIACLLCIVGFLQFSSCANEELQPDEALLGYDYYPVDIGLFYDYEIKQTSYFPNDPTTNETFQIRELLESTFTGVDGIGNYKIQRYKRPTSDLPWALDSVYSVRRDKFNVTRSENNRLFLKLAFPLAVGKAWNGNQFNEFRKDDCKVTDMDVPYKINNFTYDKTLKVELANDSSLVYQDRRHEIYAEKVGLVYKSTKILNYCTEPSCIGQGRILSGTIRTQTLLNYGKN